MEEATPALKPAKHRWYIACFTVLLLTLAIDLFQQIITEPAVDWSRLQRVGFVAEMLGFMMGNMIVMAPGLVFVLAMLFFFDGWISRTIVGTVLAGWMVFQALGLIGSLHPHPVAEAQSAAVKPASAGADAAIVQPEVRAKSGRVNRWRSKAHTDTH